MKTILYILIATVLSIFAFIDNGETAFGLISAIIAVLMILFGFASLEPEETHIDEFAWCDISDSSKWGWK